MVAIITVNYNTYQITIDCIKSLLKSDYPSFKIYLIDNGSKISIYNQLTDELRNEPQVEIVRSELNKGYVGGVNLGLEIAEKAKPHYYLIMNNDTIIDKNAISELVKCADKHEGYAIVSGKVYYYSHPDILQHTGGMLTDNRYFTLRYPGKNKKDVGQCNQEAERDSLDDVFWLLPSRIVDDIGFYCDYYFMYAEQGDYVHKARRNGYKLIYTPNAKIWHKESITAGGGNAKALPICYWRGKSSFIYYYRNLKTRYFIIKTSTNIIKCIIKIFIKKGYDKKIVKAQFKGYIDGFIWLFNRIPDKGYNPYINTENTLEKL